MVSTPAILKKKENKNQDKSIKYTCNASAKNISISFLWDKKPDIKKKLKTTFSGLLRNYNPALYDHMELMMEAISSNAQHHKTCLKFRIMPTPINTWCV